eukprot:scaffold15474_cov338-Ochromonas_danica.AAC.1
MRVFTVLPLLLALVWGHEVLAERVNNFTSPDVHISGIGHNRFSTQETLGTSSVTLTADQWTVCPSYSTSNTDSASTNVYLCSFILCPGE